MQGTLFDVPPAARVGGTARRAYTVVLLAGEGSQ